MLFITRAFPSVVWIKDPILPGCKDVGILLIGSRSVKTIQLCLSLPCDSNDVASNIPTHMTSRQKRWI